MTSGGSGRTTEQSKELEGSRVDQEAEAEAGRVVVVYMNADLPVGNKN